MNPNLRIAAGHVAEAQVAPAEGLPPIKMTALTILAFMGLSYLQVVQYRGRFFVRDGYHRAAGLLRRGVNEVPCILIEARNLGELGCPPGAFTDEVLFGERPPFIRDYWDSSVACDFHDVAVRKVVRVRGDEFVVTR